VLAIIKIAIKEDIEKLLILDSVLFRGDTIIISPFKKQYTLVVYYKYRRFRYRARDYNVPCGHMAIAGIWPPPKTH